MLKKYWLSVVLVVALALSASCSTLNVGNSNPDRNTESFTLNVMEESYFNGSHVDGFYLTTEETEDHVMVSINARGAADLKALYFDMTYDADTLRPLSVTDSDNIASDDERLSLTHFTDRGNLSSGQMVMNPDWHAGFSGDGVLATVNFRKQSTPLLRSVSKVNTSGSGEPLEIAFTAPDQLTWYFNNGGDYDQNGEVNVADITPLGINLNAAGPFDVSDVKSVINGDGNALITIADITPIGVNIGNNINGGYSVYAGTVGDYPASNSAPDTIAALETVALNSADNFASKSTQRLHYTYTIAAPNGTDLYWVRGTSITSEPGTPSAQVGNTGDLPQLRMDAPEPPGAGTSVSPYLLDGILAGNTYTFHIYTDDTLATEITGTAGVELLTEPVGASNPPNQSTGEITFIDTFVDTTFYVSATVDSTPLTSDQRIYFRIEIAPVGLYIFKDPADTDWSTVTGDGLTDPTAYVIATNSFNTDGLTEFSFVANDQSDNAGNPILVTDLTWEADLPFVVTNNWTPAGTATFDPLFTGQSVFATDGDANESNHIFVAAENLPE